MRETLARVRVLVSKLPLTPAPGAPLGLSTSLYFSSAPFDISALFIQCSGTDHNRGVRVRSTSSVPVANTRSNMNRNKPAPTIDPEAIEGASKKKLRKLLKRLLGG